MVQTECKEQFFAEVLPTFAMFHGAKILLFFENLSYLYKNSQIVIGFYDLLELFLLKSFLLTTFAQTNVAVI